MTGITKVGLEELPGFIDEPEYSSYVSKNHFGLCLRASADIPANTVVGSKNLKPTDKEFVSDHPSVEYRHVMYMGTDDKGNVLWGRVHGKAAFVNHSCANNCFAKDGRIITLNKVKKDEELTTAYDEFIPNLPWDPKWNFQCFCNAPNCRKNINSYRSSSSTSAL